MKTLLFEQWQGGHYFNYLECLIPTLAEFCEEVVVAVTERAASSELFARQLAPLARLGNVRFDTDVPFPQGSGLAFRRQLGTNVLEAIARHRPDFVFLPSADEQLLALPLLGLSGHRRALRGARGNTRLGGRRVSRGAATRPRNDRSERDSAGESDTRMAG